MNQADVTKLMSKLRFAVRQDYRRLRNPKGPEGRLEKISKTLTALIKYERIELAYQRADESRGYVERLISDAIRHGDTHQPTMEMADFWIREKQYVHKLFKVLVPRFQNCPVSYTRMYRAPRMHEIGDRRGRAVLELRGHPFPPLTQDMIHNRNFIQNVLLDEAKKEYRREKYAQLAEKLAPLTSGEDTNTKSVSGEPDETEPVLENSTPSNNDQKDEKK